MGSSLDIEKRERVVKSQYQHHVPVGFLACKDGLCKHMLIASSIGELHLGRLRLLVLLIGASYDDSIKSSEGNRTVFEQKSNQASSNFIFPLLNGLFVNSAQMFDCILISSFLFYA